MKAIFLNLTLGIFAMLGFSGCSQATAPVATPVATHAVASNAPVAVAPAKTGYEALKGKWQRADGDYVIEVRGADADGKLDAGYFNPSPIHISQAQASREGDGVKVFIELRDDGYPGCTYKLAFDPKTEQLFGQYFQAAVQQTYDVTFARAK